MSPVAAESIDGPTKHFHMHVEKSVEKSMDRPRLHWALRYKECQLPLCDVFLGTELPHRVVRWAALGLVSQEIHVAPVCVGHNHTSSKYFKIT